MLAQLQFGRCMTSATFNDVMQTRRYALGGHDLYIMQRRGRRMTTDGSPARLRTSAGTNLSGLRVMGAAAVRLASMARNQE
jgi:hypothetical protein